MNPTTPARIAAIIPVATFEDAKSRLGRTLDAEERQDLTEHLLANTVQAAVAVPMLADVLVVSPDRDVLRRADELGARTLRQHSRGLNAGLDEARTDVIAGGADALLVLPIDLAFISPQTIADILEPLAASDHLVVLVTDRHGTGTNALALRPPDAIAFSFGVDSRSVHRAAAAAARARFVEVDGPLTFDIDTPADLVLIESLTPEGIGAG